MKIGYCRVSTKDQNLEIQTTALKEYGCELIYQEKVSGKNANREELNKMLGHVREGDTVVVLKLDRLGRSLKDLLDIVSGFRDRGINFVSISDSIDTSTPTGRLVFNVFASIAEYEREQIRERTVMGIENARRNGKKIGRQKGFKDKKSQARGEAAKKLVSSGLSVTEAAKALNVSRMSIWRYINKA